jgi:hypothetical protein
MMRLNKKTKAAFLALLLGGLAFSASAQENFKYRAALPKINASGFYRITLQPALVAKSNADLSDVRVIDTAGKFVPYVSAGKIPPQASDLQFTMLPEAEDLSKTDTVAALVVENVSNGPINQLWIKLKNTAVKRTINISGSDDRRRWFAIEEEVALQEANTGGDDTYLQSLSLPASNYRYLKISVNGKHKAPIKFLAAGIYTSRSNTNRYFVIPNVSFAKKDSDKVTYITIKLNDQYLVDRINLIIAGPKYYKRDVSVYKADKQGSDLLSTTELNSANSEGIFLSAKTNRLELRIANNDNLPLNITGITLWQAGQYITAYLEAGQTYKLLTGDNKATSPEYDLKFFTDSIHNAVSEISHGQVLKNAAYSILPTVVKKDYTLVIWVSITVALALLSFLTFKMVGDMKGRS